MVEIDSGQATLPSVMARNERQVRQGFWPKLRRFLAHVPFAEEAVAAWYCAFDAKTPLKVKGVLLAALAYFVMPLDILPDFLLGLGFTDDLTVLMTAYGLVQTHIRPEHRLRAREVVERLRRGEDEVVAA